VSFFFEKSQKEPHVSEKVPYTWQICMAFLFGQCVGLFADIWGFLCKVSRMTSGQHVRHKKDSLDVFVDNFFKRSCLTDVHVSFDIYVSVSVDTFIYIGLF